MTKSEIQEARSKKCERRRDQAGLRVGLSIHGVEGIAARTHEKSITSMTVLPSLLQTMTHRLWVNKTRQTASQGGARSLCAVWRAYHRKSGERTG